MIPSSVLNVVIQIHTEVGWLWERYRVTGVGSPVVMLWVHILCSDPKRREEGKKITRPVGVTDAVTRVIHSSYSIPSPC